MSNQQLSLNEELNQIKEKIKELKIREEEIASIINGEKLLNSVSEEYHQKYLSNFKLTNDYNSVSASEYNETVEAFVLITYKHSINNNNFDISLKIDYSSETSYENRYDPYTYYSYNFKVSQNGKNIINKSNLNLCGFEENNTSYADTVDNKSNSKTNNNQENDSNDDSDYESDDESDYNEEFNPKYWSTILNLILYKKIEEEERNWVELMEM
jgi:hypothetical protein